MRLLQSVISVYWPSEDDAPALVSRITLEDVIFLPVLKASHLRATVDPVNALALRYRPAAGRARAPVTYCDFSRFMSYCRFKGPLRCAGLGGTWFVWVSK